MKKLILFLLILNLSYTQMINGIKQKVVITYNTKTDTIHAHFDRSEMARNTYVTSNLRTNTTSERTTGIYKPSCGRPYYKKVETNQKEVEILKKIIHFYQKNNHIKNKN